ncbi:MAG: hypothetical protein IT245_09190, partial [Bacteroidia bacterium]|nr:hypothetical protein [Bacteroidia bacterium]
MANKRQDIDQFLFEKLHSLEGIQDDFVWQNISQYLEHHKAPIDLLLSKQLFNLEQHPPVSIEKQILNNPSINSPIIDQRLHALLSVLESEPDKEFKFEKKDKKRRRLLPFFLISILITSSIIYVNNMTQTEQKKDELNTKEISQSIFQESNTPHELNNLKDKIDIQFKDEKEYLEIKEQSVRKVRESFKIFHSNTNSLETQFEEKTEIENIQKELNFKNIVQFDWQLEQESNKV